MGIFLQIAIGVCLIIVTGGLINYVNSRPKESKRGIPADRAEQFEQRLNELEKRLTDIQDIIISIDEKLDHIHKPNA